MDTHPLYLNVCECDSGFYGIDCTPCPSSNFRGLGPCSGHGTCDDLLLGRGLCFCDTGYTGSKCDLCALHFKKQLDGTCVCEKVWQGEKCDIPKPMYDTSQYPYVYCKKGWKETGFTTSPINRYWSTPTKWPECNACKPFYAGHPEVACKKCLGHNGSFPLAEENVCNGHGKCWDNDSYDKHIFNCSGPVCAPGIPDGGLIKQCTATFNICEKNTDCPESFNCAGQCLSKYRFPDGPTESWAGTFRGNVCRDSIECNFQGNPYIGSILPDGWDDEGECTQFTCCEEAAVGNYSCYNCRNNDTFSETGELIRKGSMAIGRMPPACDECPGWHNDIDVNGQTICNGKGTCNPEIDAFDEYVGMMCSCTTDIGTGLPYQGEWCQCLAERENSNFCQACTQGFYLTADIESSKQQGKAIDKIGLCLPCPGAENGTGLGSCNFMKGLGSCIYSDAVGNLKEGETTDTFEERLNNIGKCSCTSKTSTPALAGTGDNCDVAPPNFYKHYYGLNPNDWVILPCPRLLALGVEGFCADNAPEYIWNHIGSDGTPRQTCTQSCGGKPYKVSMCSDDYSFDSDYLEDKFSGNWEFLFDNGTADTSKLTTKGVCFCNGNDILPASNMEANYFKNYNGLCSKSKVKYLL